MIRTACTAFRADGVTVCGREDDCTRVVVVTGLRAIERYVCRRCRKRMKLPNKDVVLMPALGKRALLLASTEPLIPVPTPERQAAFRAAFLADALGPRWCEQHGHYEIDITCVGHAEKWVVCGSCGRQRQEPLDQGGHARYETQPTNAAPKGER